MGEYSRVLRGSLVVHAAARNLYAYIIIRSRSMIVIAIDDQNNYTIDDRRSLKNDRVKRSTIDDR